MRRAELEHLIRAAAAVTGDDQLVIVGSQAILGQFPAAPASLLVSRQADVYPRTHPERADEIEGSIGAGSYFDSSFGYYAHAVGPETAKVPAGWEERLVAVCNENTGGATGWCLEVHDLLLSKCAAGRQRDWEFVEDAIGHGLAESRGPAEPSRPPPDRRRAAGRDQAVARGDRRAARAPGRRAAPFELSACRARKLRDLRSRSARRPGATVSFSSAAEPRMPPWK